MVMGSNSRGNDGEGTAGVKKLDEKYEQELDFPQGGLLLQKHDNVINGYPGPMDQLPPHGPRAYETPPPMVTQQVPMVPMQRPGVVAQPQPHVMLQNGYVDYVVHEKLKQVKISWNHSGNNVAIAGSWDNWRTTEPLENVGQTFFIVKTLPVRIYHYRFIVDGYFTYAPEFPWACDGSGHPYNILDLQDYIPEMLARLSDYECPPSPPSSYDNIFLNEDEFSKPPPELPPQLPLTMRDEPSSSNNSHQEFPRPTHLELNHLYIHKNDREPFVALRSISKFQHKYVTMVLYRSLRRER